MPAMQAMIRELAQDPAILLKPLAVFAATMLLASVVRSLLLRGFRGWMTRIGSRPGTILAEALPGPTLIWIFILAAHLAVESSVLPADVTSTVAKSLLALWIFSLTLMSMGVAGNIVRHFGSQMPGALPVTTLTQNLTKLAILILGLLWMATTIGAQITPILTALGVGGLAVALALQDTLSNLFAGFYVAVAGQIRLGDYIKLNTGEEGYVTDITWRSTAIRALPNNMIIVPNAKLGQAIVTNYHLPQKWMAASVQVTVSYDCDPDHVEKVLLEVGAEGVREIRGMLADPGPSASFDPGFCESGLGFTLNFQVEEFVKQFSVRNELRKRILRRFREEGIAIPFPTRTILTEPHVQQAQLNPGSSVARH